MGFEDGESAEHGVEGLEGGVALAEEIFEEVRGDGFMEPEKADLAVVYEVGASFFDSGKRSAEAVGYLEVTRFRMGETILGAEVVDRDDARVEVQGDFQRGGGFEEAHGVGAAVGGFGAGFEGAGFEQTEGVHAELFEIFGQDELAGRVVAGEAFAVTGEDVDRFLGDGVSDVFEWALCHASGGCEIAVSE